MKYEQTVEINASAATVWSILADIERWPEWTPTVTSARVLDGGQLREGASVRLVQPRLRPARWTVTSYRELERFAWTSTSTGIVSFADHELFPIAGGCRVRLTFAQSGPLAFLSALLFGRMIRSYVGAEAEGLKARAERSD